MLAELSKGCKFLYIKGLRICAEVMRGARSHRLRHRLWQTFFLTCQLPLLKWAEVATGGYGGGL